MSKKTFQGLPISGPVLQALRELQFEHPTPVQQEAIPPLMEGRDVVGQAQTGTGKTAAFGIPAVQQADPSLRAVQSIVLCPTRELAVQVTGELKRLGRHISGLEVLSVYGGQSIGRQIKALKRGVQIVAATPGRMIDHLERGTLSFEHLKLVIFDEADEMLNMGFRDDMECILSFARQPVQMAMFSATVSGPIRQIMQRYMKDPVMIRTGREQLAAPDIEQFVMKVRDSDRLEAACGILAGKGMQLALVFCNTRWKSKKLAGQLRSRGFGADYIGGDLSQNQRDRVMARFRSGGLDLMVATDVAARGIDVDDIDVVINYDIPNDPAYYVHRIGRTGRAGRSGTAVTLCSQRDRKALRAIEKEVGHSLPDMDRPETPEVAPTRKGGRPAEKRADEGDVVQVNFNVGRRHKVYPGDILGAITGETDVPGPAVGNIDIRGKESIVDISAVYVDQVLRGMEQTRVKGRKVHVSMAR
ncbi:MAG: DEAD/DEAH box helicase [Balneolaceae bacterium]|nr:DEAD/DEAH box helicase [Balneolaceae bacterium]